MAPTTSPRSSSPRPTQSQQTPPSHTTLPPINTNTLARTPMGKRQSSLAKDRMSTYSMASNTSQKISRPSSHMFPALRSSLPYAQVRDFAYPPNVPMHYGPLPASSATPSGTSTPAFESQVRLSDLPSMTGDPGRSEWTTSPWGEQLPQTAYGGNPDDHGPPYSEDEDLQSPIVVTSRRRWPDDISSPEHDREQAYLTRVNGDGSETYYVGGMDDMADGPGGELITYEADDPRHSSSVLSPDAYRNSQGENNNNDSQRRLHPGSAYNPESRYSRDYQFSIASPDEEMHGKAVALFDFARENENELPLVEGQVIWVSYRHGQGWLVAEDPKTRESGLVPEAYVRLLRDIQGGLHSLATGGDHSAVQEPSSATDEVSPALDVSEASPTQPFSSADKRSASAGSNGEHRPPMLSVFSTSSKDLDPYPHPELGSETGQAPPEITGRGDQGKGAGLMSPTQAPSPTVVVRKSSGRSTASGKSGKDAKAEKSSSSSKTKKNGSKRNSLR